jgi:putative membrane protein
VVAPILSEVDHARVSAAVSAAEAHSAGEIVTIVTDRSDGYSDIALAWAAFAAATALLLLSLFPSLFLAKIDALTGNWGTEWTPASCSGWRSRWSRPSSSACCSSSSGSRSSSG